MPSISIVSVKLHGTELRKAAVRLSGANTLPTITECSEDGSGIASLDDQEVPGNILQRRCGIESLVC